ncbi:MAG: Sulfate transport system permease protein CysT, partial [uncultured Nocardioides sp.]
EHCRHHAGPAGEDPSPVGPALHAHPVVGPRPRPGHDLVQPARPHPARGRGRHRVRGRLGRLLEHGHHPADRGGHPAHRPHRCGGDGGQRRDGSAHRMGAGAGPLLGQVRPGDPHRHPVRAAHHRRRARAAVALRQRQPVGRQRRQPAAGRLPGLPLRHAALRRPDGAAGAGGAGPRRRGGGGLARREPGHHVPADHPAEPRARDRGRRGPVLRPRSQRVRLAGPPLGQPPLPDRGDLRAHPQQHRERQRRGRRGGRDDPAGDLARRDRRAGPDPEAGGCPWL